MTAMVVHLFKQYLGYILVNLAPGFHMEIFTGCPHFLHWKVFLSLQCTSRNKILREVSVFHWIWVFLLGSKANSQNISCYAIYLFVFISRFKGLCASQRGRSSESVMHTLWSPTWFRQVQVHNSIVMYIHINKTRLSSWENVAIIWW